MHQVALSRSSIFFSNPTRHNNLSRPTRGYRFYTHCVNN